MNHVGLGIASVDGCRCGLSRRMRLARAAETQQVGGGGGGVVRLGQGQALGLT